jgi:hypothetical protein
MRILKASLTALLATGSSLALTGCLGTNTPPSPPAAIYESASGTGYVATRGAGFEAIATTSSGAAINGGAVSTDAANAALTAFTNAGTGATGFILSIPSDASISGTADTATLSNGSFATSAQAVFPAGTQEATITTTGVQTMLVDKFGASQGLQDSEYGIWAEPDTVGLSATTATTAGVFAVGIPTAIMPTSGTAIYTGSAEGIATTATGGGEFSGTATLNATFTAAPGGTIYGSISDMKYSSAGSGGAVTGTMNDIELATIGSPGAIAGNSFSGAASAGGVSGIAGATNLNTSGATTGKFGGTFNGLSAGEVAGTFQLTGGGVAVAGAFGAKQ